MLHQHQPAQASSNQSALQSSKSVRRKRLQHCIRQIKRLIAERIPPMDPEKKLGTIDVLDKAVELLRATPVFAEVTNPGLSPPHSWPDSPLDSITHISDDTWTPNVDFARRHIFSANINLPDGRITEFQKVTSKEINSIVGLHCGTSFLDVVALYGRQALLAGAYNDSIEKKKFLHVSSAADGNIFRVMHAQTAVSVILLHNCCSVEKTCNEAFELLCEYKRSGHGSTVSTHIHALELESAFGPSKMLSTFVFSTRHTNSCSLTHLDSSAANYIGYLPGEVISQSILHLLHPYDMTQIKQIHATLSVQRSEIVRQRRLRWIAFNGSIIHTNSEWFAFWNPWTHKVDSIIGRHTLNEQPIGNADVLAEPCAPRIINPLDELTIRNIESEITAILNKEPIILIRDERYKAAPIAHQKNSNSVELKSSGTHLGTYIDNLIETFVINAGSPGNKYLAPVVDACRSPINPTDLSSANCCNAIPLTYNQINCLENVHRLLKSQQHAGNVATTPTTIETAPKNILSSKLPLSEDSKSPFPVPEQEDDNRMSADIAAPAMPLTRELLQQHTRKWEQEYHDTWKKRLGLKRSIQQTEFVVPVSSKIFRESSHRLALTQSAPAALPSPRSDCWAPMNKDDYYRSLGPNPPPPPGKNFQITSVPLPPPLPTEERRSAFAPLPSTAASPFPHTLKLPRDISQPINLSLTGNIHSTVGITTQHRSVIKTALTVSSQQQRQHLESNSLALPPSAGTVQRYLSTGNPIDTTLEWCPTTEYYNSAPEEVGETCAARLMNMAQRAQQQLEQKRFHSPLATSPVKEVTDALMLLQETTSF
ncbi:abnormal cell lineage protein 42 [Loa loa]|uniref:Abnormal cell lineage protein 42 n=1 Tax=Loa loa TaxID=7209 RepID=A0A1S0UJF2_LOALO|nr:abnormal cell lineage protein 42 [Loa loa]EJD75498.1 abnormal cell lineage protein 42 [Loa loa]